jgi:hypothetical protein
MMRASGAAEVEVDGDANLHPRGVSRRIQLRRVRGIVDAEHGVRRAFRESHGAGDLVAANHGRRDQQAGNAVIGEDLRFGQPGGAAANRAGLDERARDLRALVRLAVWPKGLPPRAEVRRHGRDVRFKRVQVEQEGRSGDVATKLHRARMLSLL